MADAKKVTILNQRAGKVVLPADPAEVAAYEKLPVEKRSPKNAPKPRTLESGQAIEVSEDEAAKLLVHNGLVDASKIVKADSSEVAALKKQLAAKQAENEALAAKLAEKGGKGDDSKGGKDDGKGSGKK